MISAPSIDHLDGVVIGSAGHVAEAIGSRRAIAVTDRRLTEEPSVRALVAGTDLSPLVLDPGEPTFESVAHAAAVVGAAGADVVVAVGGGSVLDTAKLAAALVASGGIVSDHAAGARSFAASLMVIAVPTTSGSGAEVSRTAVVSSPTTKTWVWDPLLRPGAVVLDPGLTTSMPESVTISTGLDAYVHAIEAATARRAGAEVTARASEAASVIPLALPMAAHAPSDIEARSAMLVASAAAGWTIDRAGTGAGHAVGHALAALAPIPHGLAVAFGMAACLEWTIADPRAWHSFEDLGSAIVDDVERLILEVDLDGRVAELASHRLDPAHFADELRKPEHRPMRANAARPITDDDVPLVSRLVTERWNALS